MATTNSSEKIDCSILTKIEQDDFLKLFVQSNFKSELLKSVTIAEQVKKLGQGIELVSRELQKQISEKHNDLICQATQANKLENILITMNLHMQNLFANAERLKNQIVAPYRALEMHTMVLSRLHLASHILRQVNRIQQLSKRLSNTNEPIQKATILQELEQLTTDSDLMDVDAVTTELRNIRAQQQKVVKLATSLLSQGLVAENVTQTNAALQIFNNLGTILDAGNDIASICLRDCEQSLKVALETPSNNRNKSALGRINVASSQGFRNKIWDNLEKVFSEEIFGQSKQIRFLQESCNSLNFCTDKNFARDFWEKLGKAILEEIINSVPAVRQMMETDFPKLLKVYRDLTLKLNYDNFVYNHSLLENWENLYLSSSLNRLLEPTQTMFNQENSVPSHDKIDALIRSVTNELSISLVENCLSEKIAKNVSKCIRMFAVKTEQQLCSGPEAAQVIGGTPNLGQQLNVQLANALYYFQVQVQRMLANMKTSLSLKALDIIDDSLQGLKNLTCTIIQPLIISTNSTIERIIITIHLEDWVKYQAPNNRSNITCSPYMRELSQFLSRVNTTYLTPFENKQVLATKCGEVVIRCIELLVRHSSLLRPLSQGGRLRLQADYCHLETALKGLYLYLSDLGKPYRLFKSMATLITLTPQEIIERQTSSSSVPHSTVLLLLFSYAGPELASPHQNANWSLAKLSAWLDENELESDRLNLITGALQRYENLIRQQNMSNYDPVYPIMSKFLAYTRQI